jgi:hypothetical protein
MCPLPPEKQTAIPAASAAVPDRVMIDSDGARGQSGIVVVCVPLVIRVLVEAGGRHGHQHSRSGYPLLMHSRGSEYSPEPCTLTLVFPMWSTLNPSFWKASAAATASRADYLICE